jgi:hypothetical protein
VFPERSNHIHEVLVKFEKHLDAGKITQFRCLPDAAAAAGIGLESTGPVPVYFTGIRGKLRK